MERLGAVVAERRCVAKLLTHLHTVKPHYSVPSDARVGPEHVPFFVVSNLMRHPRKDAVRLASRRRLAPRLTYRQRQQQWRPTAQSPNDGQ